MELVKRRDVKKWKITGHNKKVFVLLLVFIIILIGLVIAIKMLSDKKEKEDLNNNQIANPASVYCVNNSGKLEIRTDENGSQYGICIKNNEECEEWKYFRGECCLEDSDCVQSSCCHATSCTNKINEPNCAAVSCTAECAPNTLDCGQASCKCVNQKCSKVENLDNGRVVL